MTKLTTQMACEMTSDERVDEAINRVKNLHPETISLIKESIPDNVKSSVVLIKKWISQFLGLSKSCSTNSKTYWMERGWKGPEIYYKIQESSQNRKGFISPFSREFWLNRVNPSTNTFYTVEEADYERNVRRPIRKEFWIAKGYSEEDAIQKALNCKHNNNNNGIRAPKDKIKSYDKKTVSYWVLRGCSEDEAKEIISNNQRTFSLSICIEKYGEEEGRRRWLERQMKWHTSFKKSNYSKVSQELFWELAKNYSTLEHITFATLDTNKNKDDSGCNHESRLKLSTRVVLPDFLDKLQKKVIEFEGTYWHGEVGRGNKTKDEERHRLLEENGYKVFCVSEKDFYDNRERVIEQCLNFLKP